MTTQENTAWRFWQEAQESLDKMSGLMQQACTRAAEEELPAEIYPVHVKEMRKAVARFQEKWNLLVREQKRKSARWWKADRKAAICRSHYREADGKLCDFPIGHGKTIGCLKCGRTAGVLDRAVAARCLQCGSLSFIVQRDDETYFKFLQRLAKTRIKEAR